MTFLIAASLLGGWLVHKANQAYDGMRNCYRYRDFKKIARRADTYEASYCVLGLASLVLPGGAVVPVLVFSYALYRRYR